MQGIKSLIQEVESLFTGSGTNKPIAPTYRSFTKKWSWYHQISELAKDDIQQIDNILKMSVIEVFNFISYQVDKSRAKEEQRKFEEQMKLK